MEVYVNSEKKTFMDEKTLEELVLSLGLKSLQGIAAAINEEVIPREKWGEHQLHHNDSVLLITAAQGG